MNTVTKDVLNIIFGIISLLSIISGFLIKEFQVLLWSVGFASLVIVVLGYYTMKNHDRINNLSKKFKKIEETLNIYDRLNKIEVRLDKMNKKGQINLIDIIKIGFAIILIWAFVQVISSLK